MEEAFVADYGIYYLNKFIMAMEFFVGKIIFYGIFRLELFALLLV